ncbi:uncharacterized protein LOC104848895 isoform X2 [Fukomys damarensis]|uniref:uncharacterized protein LOC104848895 isoform X2 n=1 Tax=Fukomys damarensis TaxID=885580 RepID=UPI00054028E1|nr:uncharacterized protein LOC104848895 isoform X2 [Fukomys damarensis]
MHCVSVSRRSSSAWLSSSTPSAVSCHLDGRKGKGEGRSAGSCLFRGAPVFACTLDVLTWLPLRILPLPAQTQPPPDTYCHGPCSKLLQTDPLRSSSAGSVGGHYEPVLWILCDKDVLLSVAGSFQMCCLQNGEGQEVSPQHSPGGLSILLLAGKQGKVIGMQVTVTPSAFAEGQGSEDHSVHLAVLCLWYTRAWSLSAASTTR